MKSLKQHIQDIQKSLRIGIYDEVKVPVYESLRIGINDSPYIVSPTTFKELRQSIEKRFEEFGPGTPKEPIDFNDIDVSGITTFVDDYIGVFCNTKFEYIDISNWDVSNVKYMNNMFWGCTHLKSVGDLSNWDVSNVRNMNGMFYGCIILKSVGDLSNWDVSNAIDIHRMFGTSGIINRPKWYEE